MDHLSIVPAETCGLGRNSEIAYRVNAMRMNQYLR